MRASGSIFRSGVQFFVQEYLGTTPNMGAPPTKSLPPVQITHFDLSPSCLPMEFLNFNANILKAQVIAAFSHCHPKPRVLRVRGAAFRSSEGGKKKQEPHPVQKRREVEESAYALSHCEPMAPAKSLIRPNALL